MKKKKQKKVIPSPVAPSAPVSTEVTKVKSFSEAWNRLKYLKSFWLLIALFLAIPLVRLSGY
jgi:hypothetical protein